MESNQRGMLLLDKPVGLTSFQAIGACKRLFGTKKIGHAGTLDKFASGLLLVFVGEATRLVPWFVGLDKRYHARIRFGSQTTTLDPEGDVIRTAPIPSQESVCASLPMFTGPQQQVPPEYSAIHIDGKRAYERVLAGEILDLKPRSVHIFGLEAGPWSGGDFDLGVHCSSGTYVRSLARDIGESLGSAAHLIALRRDSIGRFVVGDAVRLPERPEPHSVELPEPAWLTGKCLAQVIPGLGMLELDSKRSAEFRNGKMIREEWFTVIDEQGNHSKLSADISGNGMPGRDWAVVAGSSFLGIINLCEGTWRYRLVFPVDADTSDS